MASRVRSGTVRAMDITTFNASWLRAWSDKDTDQLVSDFYHREVVYRDGQATAGLRGSDALRAYLENLFASTPPMRYEPDEVWPIPGGFCGRWHCTIAFPDGGERYLRGFDLVLLKEGRIVLNEVYTHTLA